jgi:hypothetical protein
MSRLIDWFKNIFAPPAKVGQPLWEQKIENIDREMRFFKDAFRIGILCQWDTQANHDAIQNYKKELDNLGYETEVLMFVNDKEMPRTVFLPNFTLKDIDKNNKPYNPRIDRFLKKKFDMLLNLYTQDHIHLAYVAQHSVAKCRVAAYQDHLIANADLFVHVQDAANLTELINKINEILQKQAYERKHI